MSETVMVRDVDLVRHVQEERLNEESRFLLNSDWCSAREGTSSDESSLYINLLSRPTDAKHMRSAPLASISFFLRSSALPEGSYLESFVEADALFATVSRVSQNKSSRLVLTHRPGDTRQNCPLTQLRLMGELGCSVASAAERRIPAGLSETIRARVCIPLLQVQVGLWDLKRQSSDAASVPEAVGERVFGLVSPLIAPTLSGNQLFAGTSARSRWHPCISVSLETVGFDLLLKDFSTRENQLLWRTRLSCFLETLIIQDADGLPILINRDAQAAPPQRLPHTRNSAAMPDPEVNVSI